MPKLVRLKLSVVEDLAEGYAWYETKRAGLGDEFLAAIGKSVDSISRHPLGNAVATKETRRALVKRFPFSIFYSVHADEIIVRAIFHNSRKPSRWKKRLRDEGA